MSAGDAKRFPSSHSFWEPIDLDEEACHPKLIQLIIHLKTLRQLEEKADYRTYELVSQQIAKTMQLLIEYATYLDQEWLDRNARKLSVSASKRGFSSTLGVFLSACYSLSRTFLGKKTTGLLEGFLALPFYAQAKENEFLSKVEGFLAMTRGEFEKLIAENESVFIYAKKLKNFDRVHKESIEKCQGLARSIPKQFSIIKESKPSSKEEEAVLGTLKACLDKEEQQKQEDDELRAEFGGASCATS